MILLDVSEDGLLLATVQVYSPLVVTVRVWVYCAVTGSFNTVSFCFPVIVTLSLVQKTVVAGPPVEIQVRVNWSESYVTSPVVMIPTVKTKSASNQKTIRINTEVHGAFMLLLCMGTTKVWKAVKQWLIPPLSVYSPT